MRRPVRLLITAAAAVLAAPMLGIPAAAAGPSTTTVPITTFSVSQDQCAGGVQPQAVQQLQWEVQSLLGPRSSLPIPSISPDPGCTPPSPALNALVAASNTVTSSPSGSATVTSHALGNVLLPQRAYVDVELEATIPLSSPATSVDVSIPYTTAGVSWMPPGYSDQADAGVVIGPPATTYPKCADGSYGSMTPYDQTGSDSVFPFGTQAPAGAGTYDRIRFYCPSGGKLASGLGFRVVVSSLVLAANGQMETATADFRMHDVTATING